MSVILKALEETLATDAEWILWMDIDTIMPDLTVLPRFEAYEGHDLVMWGDRPKLMEGEMNKGVGERGYKFHSRTRCLNRMYIFSKTKNTRILDSSIEADSSHRI